MFNEEIEEVRELLYNIVKDYPTGITSTFLEEQYSDRYVQARLANPLPVNWLNLLRQAEEFRVRDVSTYTLLYLADARIPHQPEQWETIASQQQEGTPHLSADLISAEPDEIHSSYSHNSRPQTEHQNGNSNLGLDLQQLQQPQAQLAQFTFDQFEPAPLSSMTTNEPIEIRIISALDPDTIFFRLGAWDPYCAYLYAALSHLPSLDLEGSSLLRTGQVLGAKIDGKWERVVLIRRSTAQSDYWIVNMVDAGNFHGVHVKAFRPLTEAITAFKKIFLAMCKLDRIQSRMINQLPNELAGTNDEFRSRVRWPPESQHYISEALQPATLKEKRVELVPFGEWGFHRERRIPMCTGRLLIEEVDFGEQLVSMGLAQRM